MLDRTIPFCNIIMRCDRILPMEIKLPEGYRIRTYQPGDENAWADMECAIGEFNDREAAIKLFTERYLADGALTDRIFFAIAPDGEIAGIGLSGQMHRYAPMLTSFLGSMSSSVDRTTPGT